MDLINCKQGRCSGGFVPVLIVERYVKVHESRYTSISTTLLYDQELPPPWRDGGAAASQRCAFMSLMPAHALHANAAAWTKYPSIAMDGMDCGHRHMHRIACLPSQPASVPEALDMITCTQHFAIVTLACSHRPNRIASRPMLAAGRTFALRSVTTRLLLRHDGAL